VYESPFSIETVPFVAAIAADGIMNIEIISIATTEIAVRIRTRPLGTRLII
jgi:hypothetical protein